MVAAWIVLALVSGLYAPMLVSTVIYPATVGWFFFSRWRCRRAVLRLVYLSGKDAGLRPVEFRPHCGRDASTAQEQIKQEQLEACFA